VSEVANAFHVQKNYFDQNFTRSLEWRFDQLSSLEAFLKENQTVLFDAAA
jgi:hypothetical protein